MTIPAQRQRRIAEYRERLAGDPGARVFAPLADLLRLEGRVAEALEVLERGLAADPAYLTARVIHGRALLDAGRTDRAREVLRGVLADDPENLLALRLLAEDALGRGDVGAAGPLLRTLVDLDPEPEAWRAALGGLAAPGPARDEAGPGAGPDRDPSFATMTLVDIYLAQGYRDKARAVLERILAANPDHRAAAERLAVLADAPDAGGDSSLLGGVRPEPGDPAERGRLRTERRHRDKRNFEEWISRLRDDGGAAP